MLNRIDLEIAILMSRNIVCLFTQAITCQMFKLLLKFVAEENYKRV